MPLRYTPEMCEFLTKILKALAYQLVCKSFSDQSAFKPLRTQQDLYHHRIGDIRTHAAVVLKGRDYPFLHPLTVGGGVDHLG